MALAVAMNDRLGHRTSSPALTPEAISARCRAVVHEDTATAHVAPTYSANRFSNSATLGPWLTQPLRRAARTAFSSSAPIEGRATGMLRTSEVALMTPPPQLLPWSS